MRKISVLNFKGGTGKSSTAQNLADAVARRGHNVLLIDGDRQSNSTITLLGERVTPSLSDVMTGRVPFKDAIKQARENLYVIPSDTNLDHVITYLKEHRHSFYIIKKALNTLSSIDLVLIDQAGAFTAVMEALLLASDEIIIPCELEPYSVQGIFDMFDKLSEELPDHELDNGGIIPYAVDLRPKMTHLYLQELRTHFGDLVLPEIRTDQTVPNAQSVKKTVWEYDKRSPAAIDFNKLAAHFIPTNKEATA